MNKKTIILTDKQLDEIANGVSSYLDSLGTTPDMPDDFASQISAQGSGGEGESYADPETTDDFGKRHYPEYRWAIGPRTFGKGPSNIHEMSKKDWEKKYVLNEGEKNGQHLSNINFGNSDKQYSDDAMTQYQYRKRKAAKQALNGSTPEEKIKGLQSLQRIDNNNGESRDVAEKQFNAAKASAKVLPKKIKSAPKPGVGTTHDKNIKNGIITLPKK